MGFIKLKKLASRKNLPIIAGIVLVFGLFGTVYLSQEQQDPRSRAAGTGGNGNCSTVNPSSGEPLISNNCTISSGFNGSVFGDNNVIQGGLGGGVYGNRNNIYGGVNGCISGNENEIWGGVNGGVQGTGNIIHGAHGEGPCPHPTNDPPTPTPTRAVTPTPTAVPNGTCADGIDNNQNELIDSQDPVCHTDGNQNNPDSYDPTRNEGPMTPTVTPTRTPTVTVGPTISITPTPTSQPTVTTAPGSTSLSLRLLLHGIGKGGDSANPNSGGNPNPVRTQRSVTVEVLNSQNQLVLTKEGSVNFNPSAGNFTGTVSMGTSLSTGVYTVKVKSPQFLRTLVPGIQNITAGTSNQMPVTILVNGDINGDNTLNILDYNILMGCYSDFLPPASCTPANEELSDLDDDLFVNQFDYNLFLRELTNRDGQ
jgi:hypothetical protein